MRLTCFKTLVVVLISKLITYERRHRRNTCRAGCFPGSNEVSACRVGTSSSEPGTSGASQAFRGGARSLRQRSCVLGEKRCFACRAQHVHPDFASLGRATSRQGRSRVSGPPLRPIGKMCWYRHGAAAEPVASWLFVAAFITARHHQVVSIKSPPEATHQRQMEYWKDSPWESV